MSTEANNERNSSSSGGGGGHNWEHIEKHLSMKKTIRKKMMRDLQQAFLDPEEDPAGPCQLVDKAKADGLEPNILDMLKDPAEPPHPAAAASTAPATNKKPGFWKKLTMRKSKRWFHS